MSTTITRATLDEFTRAYIEAALWSSTLDPFEPCPVCGKETVLNRWNEQQNHVCDSCSDREPNYEPPADENYSTEDISSETLAKMIADCQAFQAAHDNLFTDENCTHYSREYSVTEYAGHDFWLTRNGHGCGFWDGDWQEPAATTLTNAARACGEVNLYVGDDGMIYN